MFARSQVHNANVARVLYAQVASMGPYGVSVFAGGSCSVPGCFGLAVPPTRQCPLHVVVAPAVVDKAMVQFCTACHVDLAAHLLTTHHCYCCGQVFCGHCVDYRLNAGIKAPIKHLWLLETPRVCNGCAARIQPNHIRRHLLPAMMAQQLLPLDVCFVFDATASMSDYIDNVRENIYQIVEDIEGHHVDVRFAAIAYRDHCYGPKMANFIPFVKHHHIFERNIEHIPALAKDADEYGPANDVAEATEVGLALAQTLIWRYYATRIIILITDAPPHGWVKRRQMLKASFPNSEMFINECLPDDEDDHPDGIPADNPNRLDEIKMAEMFANDGVTIFTVGVEPNASSGGASSFLRQVASITNGLHVSLGPTQSLHHFIAGLIWDVLLRQLVAQEMRAHPNLATGDSKASLVQMILSRIRNTRNVPHLVVGTAASPNAAPVVTSIERRDLTADTIQQYVAEAPTHPQPMYDQAAAPTFKKMFYDRDDYK